MRYIEYVSDQNTIGTKCMHYTTHYCAIYFTLCNTHVIDVMRRHGY